MLSDPMLSNPPAFVLLAVVIALSAYLRQLSETRENLIDEILAGKANEFPIGEPHTNKKLEYLKSSRNRLNLVAPILIGFTVVVTIRLLLLAYGRMICPYDLHPYDWLLRRMDVGILLVLLVLIIALWVMHHVSRCRENEVRHLLEAWRTKQMSTAK